MKPPTTDTGQQKNPELLSDIDEQVLLQSIQGRLGSAGPGRAVLGSGDDAAIWSLSPGQDLVVSQDALVEGKDWIAGWLTPAELGNRALAVAVSDIAAMGATPLYCLVTVCTSASTATRFIDELLDGLMAAADVFACQLVGGDLSAIDGPTVIDVSVAGSCPAGTAMRRDMGRDGDLLVVTGTLGNAAAGLRNLQDANVAGNAGWNKSWLQPTPRIKEGMLLRKRGIICAGDISDGLLADAARTAKASNCRAEVWIDSLPIEPGIRETFPDWLALATACGEDFELLFAVGSAEAETLINEWPEDLAPLHVVGRLAEGTGVSLLPARGGDAVEAPAIVSGHFRA